jgi:FAD:protein FMN transferase
MWHQRRQPGLGTWIELKLLAPQTKNVQPIFDLAYAELARLEHVFSAFQSHSELTRVNQSAFAALTPLSAEFRLVLAFALKLAKLSRGAFDPCCGTALALRGLRPQFAHTEQGQQCLDVAADYRDVQLDDRGVRFSRPLQLDLGGLAKGFVVDQLVDLLRCGTSDALVNAGGDLRCFGQPQTIHLRDPRSGSPISTHAAQIELRNQAIASTGGSLAFRNVNGARAATLVGRRRRAVGKESLSVIAGSAMHADGLTKVCWFAPQKLAQKILEQFDARVIHLRSLAHSARKTVRPCATHVCFGHA